MSSRVALAILAAVLSLASFLPRASADGRAARKWYEKATAAYGLGDYAAAADAYEKAYAERPDGAILYNAAQSHRLAGHNERAAKLYTNYLRIHPDAPNRDEVAKLITTLRTEAKPAPVETAPPVVSTPVVVEPVQPAPVVTAAPVVELTAPPPPPRKPVYKKGWFWGAVVGGAVVVGVSLGVGLALGLPPKAPSASFGHAEAN